MPIYERMDKLKINHTSSLEQQELNTTIGRIQKYHVMQLIKKH